MTSQQPCFDIAIIGGGLIGHSLVAALAPYIQNGLTVALLDSAPALSTAPPASPAFDDRATALSLGSQRLLSQWGLWESLSKNSTAVRTIEVSEQGAFNTLNMDSPNSDEPLGYIVPNRWFGRCLTQHSQGLPITVRYDTTATALEFTADHAKIVLQNDEALFAKLVVLADGGRSELATSLGFVTDSLDFHQQAIVTTVKTQHPHNNGAFERFTPLGPMAMLPLSIDQSNNHCALVWSVHPDQAAAFQNGSDADFLAAGQQAFGNRLGRWEASSKRQSYPLIRQYRPEQVRRRLVLLGNSALNLHPVAGQGFNLALRATAALAKTLGQQLADPGTLSGLLDYAQRIQSDQLSVMTFCDQLIHIHDQPLLKIPRRIALGLLDHHQLSKGWFTDFSMGILPNQHYSRSL